LLGEDFLTIFRGWHHIGSRAAGLLLSCFTSSPPSTSSQLRSNSQTSAHRRLSAAVHSTQKNLKTRKTRPFIDSLVEGSRPLTNTTPYAQRSPPTSLPTRACLLRDCFIKTSQLTERIQFSTRHQTPATLPPNLQTNVRAHFPLFFPDPAARASSIACPFAWEATRHSKRPS
jgi:hypothetical protein